MQRPIPTRSPDTDAEADRVQIELLRSATPTRRAGLALSLTATVVGVVRVTGAALDRSYLVRWAPELGVSDLLGRALAAAAG